MSKPSPAIFLAATMFVAPFAVNPGDAEALFFGKWVKTVRAKAKRLVRSARGPARMVVPPVQGSANATDPKGSPSALLERFKPIFYLHKDEKHFPMSVEAYFTDRHTSVWDGKKVIIPAGQVTMEKIYQEYLKRKKRSGNVYLRTHEDAKFGTRPTRGRLRVPIYGAAFQQGGHWYLQYFSIWGYNGFYRFALLGFKFKPKIGGQHWADIEHITIKLNRAGTDIEEIYFAAHGGDDGMTVPRRMLEFERGRPVVYSAVNGHGSYPRKGIYIRIASVASDITGRGTRWDPRLVRVYPDHHPKFDPRTMGWIYVPGNMGPDGVSALGYKDWFMKQGSVSPGVGPTGKPCTGRPECAAIEKPAFGPLENWCPSASDKLCILKKMGKKAVWKPIVDTIKKTLKDKVIAPVCKFITEGVVGWISETACKVKCRARSMGKCKKWGVPYPCFKNDKYRKCRDSSCKTTKTRRRKVCR